MKFNPLGSFATFAQPWRTLRLKALKTFNREVILGTQKSDFTALKPAIYNLESPPCPNFPKLKLLLVGSRNE